MANNDVRLDDLVDIKSVKKQFDTITEGYKLIGEEYANLTVALAKKIGENPSGLDGLADKQKKCNAGLKELIATQNKLSAIQEKQLSVLSRIEKSITSYAKAASDANVAITKESVSVNANTQAIDSNTKATEILNRAKKIGVAMEKEVADIISVTLGTRSENLRALAKEQNQLAAIAKEKKSVVGISAAMIQREVEVKNAMAETNSILNNQQKIMNAAPGSHEDMTLSLARMELAYSKLNRVQRDSSAGQGLLGSIGDLSGRVKEYQSALKKVGDSNIDLSPINKLLREQEGIYASLNASLGERQHRVLSEARATQEATLSIGQKNKTEVLYLATVGDVNNLVNTSLQTTERRIVALNEEKGKLMEVKAQLLMVNKAQEENLISVEASAKAKAILVLQESRHKIAISNMEQSLNNEQKLLLSAANSGKESALMLERMRIAYHSLSEEVRSMPVGRQLLSDIQVLDKQVKASDASIGNHQRNVGHYKMAFDGLGMSVQQVARELPSLAMGWNTFFLAISNNLPILADELKNAKAEFKAMKDAGQEGVPVWKRMTGAIFNWQTALVVGITLLSVYGKDIMNWVGKLFKAKNAVDDLLSAEQELALARKKAVSDSRKEGVELDLLYGKLKSTTISTKERSAAVGEWIKKYPQHSNIMNGELISMGKLDSAYQSLSKQIIETAKARAYSDKITELESKKSDILTKRQNQYVTYLKAIEDQNKAVDEYNKKEKTGFGTATAKIEAKDKIFRSEQNAKDQKKAWLDLIEVTNAYDKSISVISKNIKVDDLFPQPKEGTKQYWDNVKSQAVSALEQIDSKQKEILDNAVKNNKDLSKLGIDESIVNSYKDATKQIGEANKSLSVYEDLSMTNKQIEKEAESHVKYMVRIENELAEAKSEAIENRRNSEVEGVKAEYQKKLSAIKGGSEKELELRNVYADAQAKEIAKINDRYNREIDTGNIEARLLALREDNDAELEERLALLLRQNKILRDAEVKEAKNTGKDIELIREKYAALDMQIIKENAEKRASLIGINAKIGNTDIENAMDAELNAARLRFQLGLNDRETYEKEKLAITTKYLKQQLEIQIEAAERMAAMDGLSVEQKKKYEQEIAALRNKLVSAGMDVTDSAAKGAAATTKEWWDGMDWKGKTEFVAQSFADMFGQVSELISTIYDGKIEKIEEEQEANQEAGDAEIERITHLEETGVITKEEAEARKRAAEQRTAEKDKELAKKKADLQTRQAKMDKANAIVQTIIATALAVIKAMPNIPLSVIAGVAGAASLATIIAQPIPKYAKGTDNHPGGLAVVGDGGREEMIVSGGKSWITPSVPTLVDIPKGAVVLPDVMNMESIRGMRSDVALLLNEKARKGEPVTVNVNNDYRRLEGGIDRLNSSFNKMAKYQRKAAVQADLRNIANRL